MLKLLASFPATPLDARRVISARVLAVGVWVSGMGYPALAQSNPGDDIDLAAPISVPAPPQPMPVAPATPLKRDTPSTEASAATLAPAPDADGHEAPAAQVSLSARSRFWPETSRMGDTPEYRIEVTWQDTRVPVLVLAPDSIDFTGLRVVDQSTRHEKSASDAKVENRTLFIYSLLPERIGTAKAAALKVRYTTGLSGGHEEAVFAPAAHVEIKPARFAFLKSGLFLGLAVAVLVATLAGVGIGLGRRGIFKTRRRKGAGGKAEAEDAKRQVAQAVMAIRTRIGHGESRDILAEMERLALQHLIDSLRADGAESTPPRFDPLLDQWLSRNRDDLDRAADWERLRELFRQARYAGGHKEAHELQDAWRAMRRCLGVIEES